MADRTSTVAMHLPADSIEFLVLDGFMTGGDKSTRGDNTKSRNPVIRLFLTRLQFAFHPTREFINNRS
jgi:hypothetical protein